MKNAAVFFISFLAGFIFFLGYQMFFQNKKTLLNDGPYSAQSKFSLAAAPTKSLVGSLLSFSGTVDWQSRMATQGAKLTTLRKIQQGEVVTTEQDGKADIQFPNVARIRISRNSSVNFIQTLPVTLVVQQDTGTATYTSIGTTFVAVHALDLLVESREAQFKISIQNTQITATVQSGQVSAAYNDTQNVSHILTINAPGQFVFDNETKEGSTL